MERFKRSWTATMVALMMLALLLATSAHAEQTFRGLTIISKNEAEKISTQGGANGGGKVSIFGLSFGGGGGKGVKDPLLNIQGVYAKDVNFNATVGIMGNKAREVTVDGAHLNLQGVMVRR